MATGMFISIEGIEGAGKSTAIQLVSDYLKKTNKPFVLTREPGGTGMAEEIRTLLLRIDDTEKMQLNTELLLMFAARSQNVSVLIKPSLAAGKWVVSDRFIDASYAYQGGGRGISMEHIKFLDHWIVGDVYPNLTLLLDVDAETGLLRAQRRGLEKDRIEQEKIDFFTRVRNVYLARAKQDSKRIKVIDANQPLYGVESQIRAELDVFFTRI